jgi:hypothetical protein
VTEPDDTYTAKVIEEALLAAAAVAERVYEMAPGVSTGMEGTFRDLAEAVFRWTEGLDLQQELADEGARAGAVADVADPTYAASYAVTVHQVLTAARAVQEAAAREPDILPASAAPLLDRLGSAVREWERQPDAAARWWEEGGRPALIHPVGAPPPTPDPPATSPPSARRSSGSPPWDLFHPAAAGPGDDAGSAARADRPVASRSRPDDAPLWEPDRPDGVRAAKPLTDDDRRRRDQLNREGAERTAQERERQRGAHSSQ